MSFSRSGALKKPALIAHYRKDVHSIAARSCLPWRSEEVKLTRFRFIKLTKCPSLSKAFAIPSATARVA